MHANAPLCSWQLAPEGDAASSSASAAASSSSFASPPRRPSGGAELVRALRELSTSVQLAAAPGAPPPGGVRESDEAFLAAKARAAALERLLVDASARAERLVGRAAASCDALGDAGLALVRLSKFEEAEGARRGRFAARGAAQRLAAADARAAGAAAVRACRLGRAAAGQLAAQLAPLHGHLSLAPSVSRAVADRAEALLTWQTLAAEADAKRAKAARTQEEPLKAGGPFGLGATTPASKSAALEALAKQARPARPRVRACLCLIVRVAFFLTFSIIPFFSLFQVESVSAAAAAAAAEYDAIRARNAAEFARLDAARNADFAVRHTRTHTHMHALARAIIDHATLLLSVPRAAADVMHAAWRMCVCSGDGDWLFARCGGGGRAGRHHLGSAGGGAHPARRKR
jgi:hypothetical protein